MFFPIPERNLGKADVTYTVMKDGAKLGTLLVSKEPVVLMPVGNEYGYWLDWTKFGQIMVANGRRKKVGKP